LDIEVCTFRALERAWREASEPHQREHVMPYLYEQEGRFRVLVVDHNPDYGSMRWTVDTPEDLELVRQIYAYFEGREDFTWYEVINLFQRIQNWQRSTPMSAPELCLASMLAV
jgi:spore coat polysaccharide biosynthesis protein SpsF